MRAAVLTVSSSRTATDDASGDTLERLIGDSGFELSGREWANDERAAIETALRRLAVAADLVLTTGGTGLTADDVTPEATLAVVDREVPGIAEALRAASLRHTPLAMISRATAGTIGSCLIVNLPGSPRACEQCFAALRPVLEHAHDLLNR
ncbi:MAG: MogA/MoaB family molybdenum cofactor biosynthesis protein [Solirubrobacterales bacterium]